MKDLSNINKFFEIKNNNIEEQIFEKLSKLISFEYGVISLNDKPEYFYGVKKENLKVLKQNLKYKNTPFGNISIYSESFCDEDYKIFETCSYIISNIIKDNEISKIMKLQVKAIQEGYENIKKADEIKTKFISHISHELRTPLNSIIGFSDILKSEFVGELNQKQKEYINDIQVSGLNLLNMINEILDMSKIESGIISVNKKVFDTKTLAAEVENIIKPLLYNKELNFKKEIDDFEIRSDYQKLQQIILNLLSNAIKFTPDKGEIILKIKKHNKNAEFFVIDNGIGIKKEFQDRIFDKFEQLNNDCKNSTGLGLAITKEFVKILNGQIFVKSALNKGSKFIVTIPLSFDENLL